MARLARIAPELPVANVAEATQYYQDKLGFRLAMQMPDGRYAIVERDESRLQTRRPFSRSEG